LSLDQHLAVDGALPVLIEAEAERVIQPFKAEVGGAAAIRTIQERTMVSEVRHSFHTCWPSIYRQGGSGSVNQRWEVVRE
jgi:hypothetical protein